MIRWIALGLYNIRRNPSFFGSLVRGLGIMVVTLSAFFVFNAGITSFYDKLIVMRRNSLWVSASLISDSSDSDTTSHWETKASAALSVLDKTEHLLSPIYSATVDIPAFLEKSGHNVLLNRAILQVDGVRHQGINDSLFDSRNGISQSVPFEVDMVLEGGRVLPQNRVRNFQYSYNRDPIIAGTEMRVSGEMMMSAYMLERFGISDGKSLIGKQMSFEVDGIPLFQATLSGILDSDYFRLFDTSATAQIILLGNAQEFLRLGANQLDVCYEIYAYENSTSVWDSVKAKGLSDDVYYDEDAMETVGYLVRIRELIHSVVLYAVTFILIASFLNLFSLVWIQLTRKESYNAMCQAMGMSHMGISSALAVGIIGATIISTVISGAVSVVLVYVLDGAMSNITGVSIAFSSGKIARIVGLTSLGVGAVVFTMAWLILQYLKRKPVAVRLRRE